MGLLVMAWTEVVRFAQVGLAVLKKKGTVLKCYSNMAETVTYSEIGMSMAIIEAGYNIDSLMLRYQASTTT